MPHKAITEALKPKKGKVPTGFVTNLPALATQNTFRTIQETDSISRSGLGGKDASALIALDVAPRSVSVPLGDVSAITVGTTQGAPSVLRGQMRSRGQHRTTPNIEPDLMTNPHKATVSPQVAKRLEHINKFIEEELRILSTQCETPLEGSQQRLSVFQAALKMLLSVVHSDVAAVFERIVLEYDTCMRRMEQRASETSLMKERKKIEDHYHVHYTEVAAAKERDLQARKNEFQTTESKIIANYKRLENQVATLREENERMRRSQNDDHDRMLSMSQAVIESRLAMQKAELAHKEISIEIKKIRAAERQNFELINDHQDMSKLLREYNVPFEPRCKFAIDALLGTVR